MREEDLGLAQTQQWRNRKRRRQKRSEEGSELAAYLKVLQRIDREVPADETGDLLVFLTGPLLLPVSVCLVLAVPPRGVHKHRISLDPLRTVPQGAAEDQS